MRSGRADAASSITGRAGSVFTPSISIRNCPPRASRPARQRWRRARGSSSGRAAQGRARLREHAVHGVAGRLVLACPAVRVRIQLSLGGAGAALERRWGGAGGALGGRWGGGGTARGGEGVDLVDEEHGRRALPAARGASSREGLGGTRAHWKVLREEKAFSSRGTRRKSRRSTRNAGRPGGGAALASTARGRRGRRSRARSRPSLTTQSPWPAPPRRARATPHAPAPLSPSRSATAQVRRDEARSAARPGRRGALVWGTAGRGPQGPGPG
jgi:hypothetical protein